LLLLIPFGTNEISTELLDLSVLVSFAYFLFWGVSFQLSAVGQSDEPQMHTDEAVSFSGFRNRRIAQTPMNADIGSWFMVS
jgi:hypothetical protein